VTGPGELVRLGAGSVEVEVLPAVGARIHRLRVHGQDLLRVPDDIRRHVDDPYFWGSYPMAPWCNRIAAGRKAVAGRELDLPASFPDGTAIHGQVSRVAWAQTGESTFRIQAGGDGWPWPYEVEQAFSFGGDNLSLTLRLTNLADESMPAGVGIHPWFRRPVRVAINAGAVHPSNLATQGEPEPVAGRLDRRALEALPDGLDAAWTELSDPPIELEWPSMGGGATVEVSDSVRYVVAASPAEIDAIAVEPQTHAPAGIRRLVEGETGALMLLDPGETLEMAVRFAFKRGQT
jgi:aldose 1-epimerase